MRREDQPPRPPSLTTWLLLAFSSATIALPSFGPTATAAAGWIAVACEGIAVWIIGTWLGRWLSYQLREVGPQFMAGFDEAIEDGRRRREIRDRSRR